VLAGLAARAGQPRPQGRGQHGVPCSGFDGRLHLDQRQVLQNAGRLEVSCAWGEQSPAADQANLKALPKQKQCRGCSQRDGGLKGR